MSGIQLMFVGQASSSGSATSSFIGSYGINASQTTYNFTTDTIGASLVVVAVHCEVGNTTAVSGTSVTIGGVSATLAIAADTNFSSSSAVSTEFWYAVIGSSTTSVSVLFNTAPFRAGIGVYTIQGYNSTTPVFTGSQGTTTAEQVQTINTTSIDEGSVILAAGTSGNIYAHTWSGVTENYDSQVAGGLTGVTGASLDTSSTQTHTITLTRDTAPSQGTNLAVAIWR